MPTSTQVLFWLFTCVSAGIGAYVGEYLKKKGENLATREDFANLVEQLRVTIETAKRIENSITDEFWNKQRLWEMKRDLLLATLEAMGKMEFALGRLAVAALELDMDFHHETWLAAMSVWTEAFADFVQKRSRALLVCAGDSGRYFHEVQQRANNCYGAVRDNNFRDANEWLRPLKEEMTLALHAARTELGITEEVTS